MERAKTIYNKVIEHKYASKIREWLEEPVIVGIIAALTVFYITLMSSNLYYPLDEWVKSPVFKIMFIFIILLVHKWKPNIAMLIIVLTIIFFTFMSIKTPEARQLPNQKGIKLNEAELSQIKQEIATELNEKSKQKPVKELPNSLHPINRPTRETLFENNKVLDPNDPAHPGYKVLNDPEVDVAIYELNPPYANKALPDSIEGEKPNIVAMNVPAGGPTRYSAFHGYKLS